MNRCYRQEIINHTQTHTLAPTQLSVLAPLRDNPLPKPMQLILSTLASANHTQTHTLAPTQLSVLAPLRDNPLSKPTQLSASA